MIDDRSIRALKEVVDCHQHHSNVNLNLMFHQPTGVFWLTLSGFLGDITLNLPSDVSWYEHKTYAFKLWFSLPKNLEPKTFDSTILQISSRQRVGPELQCSKLVAITVGFANHCTNFINHGKQQVQKLRRAWPSIIILIKIWRSWYTSNIFNTATILHGHQWRMTSVDCWSLSTTSCHWFHVCVDLFQTLGCLRCPR